MFVMAWTNVIKSLGCMSGWLARMSRLDIKYLFGTPKRLFDCLSVCQPVCLSVSLNDCFLSHHKQVKLQTVCFLGFYNKWHTKCVHLSSFFVKFMNMFSSRHYLLFVIHQIEPCGSFSYLSFGLTTYTLNVW